MDPCTWKILYVIVGSLLGSIVGVHLGYWTAKRSVRKEQERKRRAQP